MIQTIMRILITIILMLSSFYGNLIAQEIDSTAIHFFKVLDDALPYAETFKGCGVTDTGYFSVGTSVQNHVKYLSLKTYDLSGNLLSDLSLDDELSGFGQVNYGKCLAQVSETEWVLAYRRVISPTNYDIRVIKFNLSGEVFWQTDLGGNYTDKARQVIVTEEGNIAIVGESFINGVTKKGYTALLESNGDLVWERVEENVPANAKSNNISIVELNSSLYICGSKEIEGTFIAYINKTSIETGNIVNESIFEDTFGCGCSSYLIPNQKDRMYFSTCNTNDYILKRGVIDTSFNFIWEKDINLYEGKAPPPVTPIIYEDESYVNLYEYDIYTPDGLRKQIEMFGLDPEGELSFVTKIPTDSTKEVYVRDLRKTPDGGYLIAGYEHFPSPQRGWLIKTDSLGNTCQLPNCDSVAYVIDTVFTSNFDITTAQSGIRIFPNPIQKNGFVNITLNDSYDVIENSQIFSIDGKQLFFSANNNTNQVPTSNLVAGIYMLKIRTRKGVVYTRRLVVQ